MQSIFGSWVLQRKGSDYVPGIESIPGIPFSTKLINENHKLHFHQAVKPCEEIHYQHELDGVFETCVFQVGRINFESVTTTRTVIGVVVFYNPTFSEISLLRMGPEKGQKRLKRMTLNNLIF